MKKFVENNIFFNKSEKTNKNYINSPNQIILLRDNISNEKTAKKNDKIEKNKNFCNKKKKKYKRFHFKKINKEIKKSKKSNPVKKHKKKTKNKNIDIISENSQGILDNKKCSSKNILIYNTNIINCKNSNINVNSNKKYINNYITIYDRIKNNNYKNFINTKKNKKKKYKKKEFGKLGNEEYDEMPYTKAKRLDKRNITKIFFLKLFEKI